MDYFFFSSRRRHTRYIGEGVQTYALPIWDRQDACVRLWSVPDFQGVGVFEGDRKSVVLGIIFVLCGRRVLKVNSNDQKYKITLEVWYNNSSRVKQIRNFIMNS